MAADLAGNVISFPGHGQPAPVSPVKRITMDDGHTRIAHGLLEALAEVNYKLSGREYAVLMVVFRKTYGYRKAEDWIALSQFVESTGISKSNCLKIIRGLVERKILNRKVQGNDQKLSVNIQVSDWLAERPGKAGETAKRKARKQAVNSRASNPTITASNPTINKSDPTTNRNNPTPTKDKKIKDNNLKDIVPTVVETDGVNPSVVDESDDPINQTLNRVPAKPARATHTFTEADRQFAEYMGKCIDAVNHTHDKRRNLDNWANDLRKMREIDRREPEVIAAVFNWCIQDNFEQTVIQSPDKLRKRFAQVHGKYIKALNACNGNNPNENPSATGQQHRSQQEFINDIDWME